jgi:hypothetical protein
MYEALLCFRNFICQIDLFIDNYPLGSIKIRTNKMLEAHMKCINNTYLHKIDCKFLEIIFFTCGRARTLILPINAKSISLFKILAPNRSFIIT